MKRLLLAVLLLLDVLTLTVALVSQCPPEKLPQGKHSRSDIPDAEFSQQLVHSFSKSIAGNVVGDLTKQGLYKIISNAPLEVVLLHAGSSFPGTIGYYIYNTTTKRNEQETNLFPDVSCADVGDTLSIGLFPKGTSLGFYLIDRNNTNYGSLAYIAQEFFVGFDGGGDKDFRVLLMIRPADNEPQSTSICVKSDTIPGSVKCYESANLIFGVAALFLPFAVTAFEGMKKKEKRTSERVLLILATLAFLAALTVCFAYRVEASSDVNKVSCVMTVISGVVTGAGIILFLIARLISDTERGLPEAPDHVKLLPKKQQKNR